jgi:hypothetical protein
MRGLTPFYLPLPSNRSRDWDFNGSNQLEGFKVSFHILLPALLSI